MKKLSKALVLCLLVVTIISTCCVGASAKQNENYTIIENMIDYNVYDSDMVYIQEHADKVAENNAKLYVARTLPTVSTLATTDNEWNWTSRGIYSTTSRNALGFTLGYYFVPVNNYLYFNSEVTGDSDCDPGIVVQKLNSDGSTTYVGTYLVTSTGDGTYEWTNYRRALTAGQKYVFSFWGDTVYSYASLDIYKAAM